MSLLAYFLLSQFRVLIHAKQYTVIAPNEPHHLDIELLSNNIRIADIPVCQDINTDDCKLFMDQMLKCQQIIFNDPGYSYQQYKRNIEIHKQILDKYQSMCESVNNDYMLNDSFDL